MRGNYYENKKFSFDTITNHLIVSGFIYPGSEIYGGLANSWDYGPLGSTMKNNLKDLWRRHFIKEKKNMYEIDPAIIRRLGKRLVTSLTSTIL